MRFHWFIPLKRGKKHSSVEKFIRRHFSTWTMSPLRRIIQAAFFIAFFYLFLYVSWPYTAPQPDAMDSLPTQDSVDAQNTDANEDALPEGWPSHYADDFERKEIVPSETILAMDPLVGVTASIASRRIVWALPIGLGVLLVCLLIPRGFCGYACPMGTLIDLFDWGLGQRVGLQKINNEGIWTHSKYAILGFILVASLFGVTLSGYGAAIPILTRGSAFIASPLQLGFSRSFEQIPTYDTGRWISIGLFAIIICLGFIGPRFWCRYLCPTGALFSLANTLRLTQRNVRVGCIGCKRCRQVCPFDSVETDFSTRPLDCTFCQTCGGSCPVQAIEFVPRWNASGGFRESSHDEGEKKHRNPNPRRRFLNQSMMTVGGGILGSFVAYPLKISLVKDLPEIPEEGSDLSSDTGLLRSSCLVRPPGALPEKMFLETCVRCGACFQACPNNVLQPVPMGGKIGASPLTAWTPQAALDWSGCDPSCNICGQVCPTHAIRPLPLKEKRVARMGIAAVNTETCLPYAGVEACSLCYDECVIAGYDAIEFIRFGTQVDASGEPIPNTGFLAPVVLPESCVGCGLCQSRCKHAVADIQGIPEAPIVVLADGRDDRIESGSYLELRKLEEEKRRKEREARIEEAGGGDGFELPDFLN
jgi:ferredoxin